MSYVHEFESLVRHVVGFVDLRSQPSLMSDFAYPISVFSDCYVKVVVCAPKRVGYLQRTQVLSLNSPS